MSINTFHYQVINVDLHLGKCKTHTNCFIDVVIVLADDVIRELSEFFYFHARYRKRALLHYSEAVRCMLLSHCMQSRSLQQYEDNPLSVCVCQDTNLPWFLSAVFTAASVTDSKCVFASRTKTTILKEQEICKSETR